MIVLTCAPIQNCHKTGYHLELLIRAVETIVYQRLQDTKQLGNVGVLG